MSLSSAVRYKPFSHVPGTICLIPGTMHAVQVFPTCYSIYDYSSQEPRLIETKQFDHTGPLEQFCVLQNLEKGKVEVSGFSQNGFVRYKIGPDVTFGPRERLFLGVDKSQDWQMVRRRCNMNEVLPYLYWLSQSIPLPQEVHGSFLRDLKALFSAGFSDLLVPRLIDTDHNGYEVIVSDTNQSPLVLLKHLFGRIRSLFFQEQNGQIAILPNLPSECHSGTLSGITTARGHTISLEWTKHLIRRVSIEAACDDEITFEFQKPIKSVRAQSQRVQTPFVLKVTAGSKHLLDNFQK